MPVEISVHSDDPFIVMMDCMLPVEEWSLVVDAFDEAFRLIDANAAPGYLIVDLLDLDKMVGRPGWLAKSTDIIRSRPETLQRIVFINQLELRERLFRILQATVVEWIELVATYEEALERCRAHYADLNN